MYTDRKSEYLDSLNIYDLTKMETAEFRGSAERESCLESSQKIVILNCLYEENLQL